MAEETAEVAKDEPVPAAPGDTEGAVVEQPQQQTEGAVAADETPVVELNEEQLKSWNALPPDQRKHLNKLFTQKTQDISEQRKKLVQYEQLAQALEMDPDTTIELLARHRGLKVEKTQPVTAPEEDAEKTKVFSALQEQFGADAAALIVKVAETLAEKKAEARTKPLIEAHTKSVQEREKAEAAAALESLTKEFPDWKQHEQAMSQLSQKLQPGPGMSKLEYARLLYLGVNPNRTSAQQTKAVLEKLAQAGKAAEPAAQSVASTRVASALPKFKDFNEGFAAAAEAARRGELLER